MSDTGAPVRIIFNEKLTDIVELKVAELKSELKKRGLSTTGNKQELHDKLRKFLIAQQDEISTQQHNMIDHNQHGINLHSSPSSNMHHQMQQQQSPSINQFNQQLLQQQQQQQQLLFEQQQQQQLAAAAALAQQQAALEAQRLLEQQQKQQQQMLLMQEQERIRQIQREQQLIQQQQQEQERIRILQQQQEMQLALEQQMLREQQQKQQEQQLLLQQQQQQQQQNVSLNDSNCSNTAAVSSTLSMSQNSLSQQDQNESILSQQQSMSQPNAQQDTPLKDVLNSEQTKNSYEKNEIEESNNTELTNTNELVKTNVDLEATNASNIESEKKHYNQNPTEISKEETESELVDEQDKLSGPVAAIIQQDLESRGNSTERSESCIKEVPMSGDRNRFSRSRSPKPRWHEESSPTKNTSAQASNENINEVAPTEIITNINTDSNKNTNETNHPLNTSNSENAINSTAQTTENVSASEGDTPKVARKRKWLSNDATAANLLSSKKVLTISTDTLKNYLPNVPAPSPTKENEISETINKNDEDSVSNHSTVDSSENTNKRKVIENSNNEDQFDEKNPTSAASSAQTLRQQTSRTVILEESNELIYEDALNLSSNNISKNEINIPGKTEKPASLDDSNKHHSANSELTNGRTLVSSNVLHISNLTRPFTVSQLKELLGKYGNLLSMPPGTSATSEKDYFWINSVKSHCYVAFENEDGAKLAREALNNTVWPQSNPKQLKVEFTNMNELISQMNSDKLINKTTRDQPSTLTALNASTGITLTVKNDNSLQNSHDTTHSGKITQNGSSKSEKENKSVHDRDRDRDRSGEHKSTRDKERERERERDRSGPKSNTVREWDLPKLAARSRSRSKERRNKDEKNNTDSRKKNSDRGETAVKNDKPPKTLDDLFRKTQTTPFVYWLPLTEEQYQERQKAEAKRVEERLKRAEERKLKEALSHTESKSEKPSKDTSVLDETNQNTSLDVSKEELNKSIEKPPKDQEVAASSEKDRQRVKERGPAESSRDARTSGHNDYSSGRGPSRYSPARRRSPPSSYRNERDRPLPPSDRGRDGGYRSSRRTPPPSYQSSRSGYDDRRSGYDDRRGPVSRYNERPSSKSRTTRKSRSKSSYSRSSRSSRSSSSSTSSSNSSSSSSSRSRSSRSGSSASSRSSSNDSHNGAKSKQNGTKATSKHARSSSENSDKPKRVKTNAKQ